MTRRADAKADFLVGGGEMGKLIRSMDWSKTPLGPTEAWPQSLRTTVSLCLASNFPMSLAWGPHHVQIYNDGYWPLCGAKHPTSMGQDYRECWASAWPAIGEAFDRGLAGEASYIENQRMFLDRNGYLEETFFTFSFSPIRDESGGVGGLFHPVTEQTAKMLNMRRTRALHNLAARTGNAKAIFDVFALAGLTLADYALDLPFTLFYLLKEGGTEADLVAHTGLTPGALASPLIIDLKASEGWPIGAGVRSRRSLLLDDLGERFPGLLCGPYLEALKRAFLLPITAPGSDRVIAVAVAGVSTRLPLNEAYRGFYDMLAASLSAAVANAHAYENERKRAEALAELDRAKTAFFSNVSHEFRTPLALMLGPIEDALVDKAHTLPAVQHDRIEIAQRNALRLLKLVNTLLDFSRLEAGRARAFFEPINLATATAELASNFRSACEKAGLRLIVDCPPLPEPVYVDRDMWEKIVLNLISNAFKFTFKGEISVSLRRIDDEHVELVVRDTGTGIPKKDLPRVFERFHRIEGAQGRTHEGSGIGLALVQELVKLHEGRVEVESDIDRGSTFKVQIPFGKNRPLADEAPNTSGLPSTAVRASAFVEEALRWIPEASREEALAILMSDPDIAGAKGAPALAFGERPKRIILADDNADMRAYVARVLSDSGFEISAVADGKAALAALRSGSTPDLVLTDVMMPQLDGFGLLKEIRNDAQLRELPVIMLSARAGEEASVEGLNAGADDYLVKPFSGRELVARVKNNLDMARLRKASTEHEYRLRRQAEAAQEELRRLNDTLEQRVAAEIDARHQAEMDLFQAQKMEAIGNLTGGMAHDFNNLLGIIIGNLDMMDEKVRNNPETKLASQAALEAALRGADLTRRLLAFARQQPLQPQRIDINKLVDGITKLHTRTLGENIQITLKLGGDVWPVVADPAQLESALTNLATNARDAMPNGGQLMIATGNARLDEDYARHHTDVAAGDYVAIEVSDTGTGMSSKVMERIFEPFYTTKERDKGTGLGLAMIFGFMKQSGGHINVYSEVGSGTTFRLYLPRAAGKTTSANTNTAPSVAMGGNETILVVEDNDGMREIVKQQLTQLGYKVLEAENAADALKLLDADHKIDLLFSDIVMPGKLNGAELALHASERWPSLKIVLTSGFAETKLKEGYGSATAGKRLLSKPYRKTDLARVLREVLEG